MLMNRAPQVNLPTGKALSEKTEDEGGHPSRCGPHEGKTDYRWTAFIACSGYRVPAAAPAGNAASSRATSSGESRT